MRNANLEESGFIEKGIRIKWYKTIIKGIMQKHYDKSFIMKGFRELY